MKRNLVGSVGVVATLLVTGCGVQAQAPVGSHRGGHATISGLPISERPAAQVSAVAATRASWPISIGTGHAPINHLAVDPSRPGVWFWSWTAQDAYAYFYDISRHHLQSWSLGSSQGPAGLDPYGDSGIAVAPGGDVWFGAYNQLVRLDPSTGAVARWTIPPPAVDTRAPASLQPWHDVVAIAVDGRGRVVIGMTAASSLQVYNPTDRTFTQIALPRIGEIDDLAVLDDGTLGVAMTDQTAGSVGADALVLIAPGGSEQLLHTGAAFVATNGKVFITGGAEERAMVGPTGSLSLVAVAANGTRVLPNVGGVGSDGRVVLGTSSGVAVVAGASTKYLDLPAVPCPGIAYPPAGSSVHPSAARCAVSPLALSVDVAGNIWLAPNLPQDRVGLIPAGSY